MSTKSNGGFPPLKIIKKDTSYKEKDIKNTKQKQTIKELPIKKILSDSIVKPMIDLNKPKNDIVVEYL